MRQIRITNITPHTQHINSQKTLGLLTMETSIPTDIPKNVTGPVDGCIMHS
jgi:hypothetical protein